MSSEVEHWKHMRNGMLEAACDPGMAEPPAYHFSTYRVDWMFSVQSLNIATVHLQQFLLLKVVRVNFSQGIFTSTILPFL